MDSNEKRNRDNALNGILQSNVLSRLRLALKPIAYFFYNFLFLSLYN